MCIDHDPLPEYQMFPKLLGQWLLHAAAGESHAHGGTETYKSVVACELVWQLRCVWDVGSYLSAPDLVYFLCIGRRKKGL
ncbi:hypothetical protein ACLOJK_020531, partial [Asimina triloba]